MPANPFASEDVTVAIGGDASGLDNAVSNATRGLGSLKKAALLAGGVLAGALAAKGIGSVVSAAADFDQKMTESLAIMGDVTDAQRKKLSQTARDVAKTTTASSEEAAQGYYYLASAGLDATQSLEAMPKVAKFAQAGNLGMAQATDYATDVMKAFGIQAKNLTTVTDTMTAVVTRHNQTMDGMGEAMSYVAPVASGLGMSIQETAAAIGELGDAGIKGTRAGTTLRQALSRLANPTGAMKKRLNKLGVSVRDSQGNMRSLSDILADLQDAGASTADIMAMFGTRAGPGMQVLLKQGGDALAEETKKVSEMGGVTDKIAKKQLNTFNNQLDLLQSKLHDVLIEIGDRVLPILTPFVKHLNDILSNSDRVSSALDRAGKAVGEFGKAVGVVVKPVEKALGEMSDAWGAHRDDVLAVVDGFVSQARDDIKLLFDFYTGIVDATLGRVKKLWDKYGGRITDAIGNLAQPLEDAAKKFGLLSDDGEPALKTIGRLLFNLLNPIGDVVLAIKLLKKAWDDNIGGIRTQVTDLASTITSTLSDAAKSLSGDIRDGLKSLRKAWDKYGTSIMRRATSIADTIQNDVIPGIVGAIRFLVNNFIAPLLTRFSSIWGRHFDGLVNKTLRAINSVLGYVQWFIGQAKAFWNTWGDEITTIVSVVLDAVTGIFGTAFDGILTVIEIALDLISGNWTGAWNDLTGFLHRTLDGVIGFVKKWGGRLFSWLKKQFVDGVNGIVDWVTSIGLDDVKSAFQALGTGIRTVLLGFLKVGGILWSVFTGFVSNLVTYVASGQAYQDLTSAVGTLLSGIGSAFQLSLKVGGVIWSAISGFIDSVVTYFKSGQAYQDLATAAGVLADGVAAAFTGLVDGLIGSPDATINGLIADIVDYLKHQAATDLTNAFVSAMKGLGNAAAEAFKNAFNAAIPDHVSIPAVNVAGHHFGGDQIDLPHLAQGGIVTQQTIAMVGEAGPEAVVPLDKLSRLLDAASTSGGGGGERVVRVVVEPNDPRFDAYVAAETQSELQRQADLARRRGVRGSSGF